MELATICLWRDEQEALVREVELADQLGYAMVCVGDSQSVYREVYVSLAVTALHTKRAQLSPMVTNPLTRHPAVTASAIAPIDEPVIAALGPDPLDVIRRFGEEVLPRVRTPAPA